MVKYDRPEDLLEKLRKKKEELEQKERGLEKKVSEIVVSKMSSLQKSHEDQLRELREEINTLKTQYDQEYQKKVLEKLFPPKEKEVEYQRKPLWELLEPGIFFEYIIWNAPTGDGVGSHKYTVSSKSDGFCRLDDDHDMLIERELVSYVIKKDGTVHSMSANGKSCAVPASKKIDIWIDSTKTKVGGKVRVESIKEYDVALIETFNGRQCFFAKASPLTSYGVDYTAYYDTETGILLRYHTPTAEVKDLLQTNLPGLESYRGEPHHMNVGAAREMREEAIRRMEKLL